MYFIWNKSLYIYEMIVKLKSNLHVGPENIFPNFDTAQDSKVHGANMGPTWVLSAPDGPHVGPMNLAIGRISISVPLAPTHSSVAC